MDVHGPQRFGEVLDTRGWSVTMRGVTRQGRERVGSRNLRQQPGPAAYDQRTDQWTITYGAGIGLIVYAIVHDHQQVIILRLV